MLLVTGITGHSGRYFLKELIKYKYEKPIRCIVRETSDTSLLESSGLKIEKAVGGLDDEKFVEEVMAGVDTIIHIASIFYSINVIKAAVKNNVRRAIFVHTTGIYSRYKSASYEYRQIEENIDKVIKEKNSKIQLIYLRPTMIYGYINDSNMIFFIKMVGKLRLIPLISGGKSLLQPVNGKDLGKAYYKVLNKPEIISGDYILSGEKPISMLEIFKLISDNLGKKTAFINVPLGLGVFMGRCLKVLTFGRVDYIEKIQRMGEDRNFSHDAARKDFGYKPMSFKKGIGTEIKEYLNAAKQGVGV